MDMYTLDWETYYGDDYTLSKMTTEEYVRDPRFESILLGVKKNDQKSYWVDQKDIQVHLDSLELHNHAVLAHHAHFDGLIANHHYGVRPKLWFDTLSMARAIHPYIKSIGLKALAELYGLGQKGEEVVQARGLRRGQFGRAQLEAYGQYCCNDCDLEYDLFQRLLPNFGKSELQLIDFTIRLFTEPVLHINAPLLEEYIGDIKADKTTLLLKAGIQLTDVMSNNLFAQALEFIGIDPPQKISPTTGKWTYAFAKTDPQMQALAEHPDEVVQTLIAARLKNKTTINESRAARMVGMSQRGPACVYLKYYGAHGTGRMSGGDKMNWQNFGRGGKLRKSVLAPPGHVLVVGDSSNIEARILDWLAGQDDMMEVYRLNDAKLGPDVYCVLAEKIYGRPIDKNVDTDERQMGKIAKLGLGFGMAARKFMDAVRVQTKGKITPTLNIAEKVVSVYRNTTPKVPALWKRAEQALEYIAKGIEGKPVDPRGVIVTCKEGLLLPNGMKIRYPDLKKAFNPEKGFEEWTFWNGKIRENIYGGKVVENIVQALARIVVMDQTLEISKLIRVVLSVHDEAVACVLEKYGEKALRYVLKCMRVPPAWAPDLPLNSEGGFAVSYGEAKK